ncbi:WD repeat-containing protein 91-like [Physella acuta]|uniref:WD repeat-containing protein 91-like n=1 Tax=Physella acuta TaxID=109671 RepID=UPI0027DD8169|nr:WD repeat-containing protein 91-like [Physella acuta]
MAASCEKLDQLVKDYLLFRGFSSTLKALDQELKIDKDKGLRVDRMMEQIWTLISGYDLQGLRDYWKYLNYRLFSRLEQRYSSSVRKLESSLLKLYIVNAHQSGRQDKVLAFYEQLGAELQSHPDFKDWFAFPFVANPSENPMFLLYFSKQWQDTLQLSLHNFLSVVLQAMPVPTLLNVEFDARRMKTLQEENITLKQQLLNPGIEQGPESKSSIKRNLHTELPPPSSPPDMVYDFSGLASDSETQSEEKQKSTRRFPLNLTSPLVGRKKTLPAKPKVTATTSSTTTTAASSASTVTSTTGSQGKTSRLAEMTVFPPTEGRKASAPALTTQSADANRQVMTGKQSTTTGAVHITRHATFSSSDGLGTSGAHVPNRSMSVPDKVTALRSKPVTSKHRSETPGTSANLASAAPSSAGSDVESDGQMIAADADSPFLLLEDEYTEHSSAATFCRFSLTGQYVASLDVDGIVKVWMWSPQPATTATVMSKSAFLSLAWASKSDRWLLLGNKTGTIRLFDVKESKTYREVHVHPDNPANCMNVLDLSTSPSSVQFVSATSDHCPFTSDLSTVTGRLLQWDLRTLKVERMLQVESTVCNVITSSAYSQSGHLLLTGGADGSIRIYDASNTKPVLKWQGHDAPVHTVQFHGEKSVYTMSADGELREWSLPKPGQLISSLHCGPRDLGKVNSGGCRGRLFSLDLDQHYLLTYTGKKGSIFKITDGASPTSVMELKSHQSPVVTVDWSPSLDTRVCLTGSSDAKIKISTLLSK